MSDTAILIGGTQDGLTLAALTPPAPTMVVPVQTETGAQPGAGFPVAIYRLRFAEDGNPALDDQGRLFYDWSHDPP